MVSDIFGSFKKDQFDHFNQKFLVQDEFMMITTDFFFFPHSFSVSMSV